MKTKNKKYIFLFCSFLLLIAMLLMSRSSGISCDEILHYQQSVSVYDYFASHGSDRSSLDTPVSHLKYYGQSYDNLVTILTRWFNIKDIYGFRNIMSSLMGWLVIFLTAIFAVRLKNYTAGFFVLFLFAVSPTFLGHSQNNLKDIPFAFGYIAGTYFIFRSFYPRVRNSLINSLFLTLSIAFCISIRAGGLILICYLYLFFLVFYLYKYHYEGEIYFTEILKNLAFISGITVAALLLSIVLWPYALQNPIKNILNSYSVMVHYPDTFRQIFEGKLEWSDFMPWYYLVKSMGITMPVIIFSGLMIFSFLVRKVFSDGSGLFSGFLIFTVIFPVFFVILEKSNLYSSWRQFLFVYPGIVLLASIGFSTLFKSIKNSYLSISVIAIVFLLSVHPLKFMIVNHPYEYMYYNQFVGGLKGAYGNYETDYYYVSQTEAANWLIDHIDKKALKFPVKVKATYSVQWQFREHPGIETSYFRNEERSLYDWDYAIVANRYISPYQLKNKIWPPENAIHIVYADKIPVCAILERESKSDYFGYLALKEGNIKAALRFFEESLKAGNKDEMIFYNFAAALYKNGESEKADSVLKKGLDLNPDFDPILMYLGNIAKAQNKKDDAIMYYEKIISLNRKYFEAYVELSGLIADNDIRRARKLLRTCLTINPNYKPAIVSLADTYRKTDPEVAKKYDNLADSIEK
jgi:hypothetical protein